MATLAAGTWSEWHWTVERSPDGDGEVLLAHLEHPDGRRGGGGMGGPVTWPGRPLNGYVGSHDDHPVVVLARSQAARDLAVEVAGQRLPAVWTGAVDGVQYLLHLLDPTDRHSVEIVGTTPSGEVRQVLRTPW